MALTKSEYQVDKSGQRSVVSAVYYKDVNNPNADGSYNFVPINGSGGAAHVQAASRPYKQYSDATYKYDCEASSTGAALTDAVWLIARTTLADNTVVYASTTGEAGYDQVATNITIVTALDYNNTVAI